MSYVLKFKYTDQPRVLDDLLFKNLNKVIYESFPIYKAARVIQKHVRGFLTRRFIQYLNRCAVTIQRTWRGYSTRSKLIRFAKLRYLESRNDYYNLMAKKIQRTWRAYRFRTDPNNFGSLKFYKHTELVNKQAVLNMHQFYKDQINIQNIALTEEKMKWMHYILPKLHHLIRTNHIPGIYSLKDGSTKLSPIEKLLACYNFFTFMADLNLLRAKNTKQLQNCKVPYKWKGSLFLREEKIWKRKNVIENPRL